MNIKNDINIIDRINKELHANFVNDRDELRQEGKRKKKFFWRFGIKIAKYITFEEREADKFKINDIAVIKCTQQGPGLKLKPKFLGPY